MRIAELYRSIQGEGELTGTDSVFVRVSGCNLRCAFCDTPYTSWSPEGEEVTLDAIVQQVIGHSCGHVVITGGEPFLFAELVPLTREFHARGLHVTIETAGTLALPVECDLMSISPKLSNSTPSRERAGAWRERHERDRNAPDVIRSFLQNFPFQLKFVVDRPQDCDEIHDYLAAFPAVPAGRVWLMPQGTDLATLQQTSTWLEPYCRTHGFRFCPRKHIEWYGFTRGT